MARYSRIRGPSVSFELPAAVVLIPGMSITRQFDQGELLILYTARADNLTAAPTNFQLQLFLDGAATITPILLAQVPLGNSATLSGSALQPIDEGLHTIDLRAQGDAAVGDLVAARSAELIIIQLPLWDQAANLITL